MKRKVHICNTFSLSGTPSPQSWNRWKTRHLWKWKPRCRPRSVSGWHLWQRLNRSRKPNITIPTTIYVHMQSSLPLKAIIILNDLLLAAHVTLARWRYSIIPAVVPRPLILQDLHSRLWRNGAKIQNANNDSEPCRKTELTVAVEEREDSAGKPCRNVTSNKLFRLRQTPTRLQLSTLATEICGTHTLWPVDGPKTIQLPVEFFLTLKLQTAAKYKLQIRTWVLSSSTSRTYRNIQRHEKKTDAVE